MGMKYKAIYLPVANLDIIRIGDALVDYPGKAKRFFIELEKKIALVEKMPYMWSEYIQRPRYRCMVLEDHLLFYKVDEDGKKIKVYRVLYSKMNILEYLE